MTPWPTGVPKGPKVREWEWRPGEVCPDCGGDGCGWCGETGLVYADVTTVAHLAESALAECAETIERLCVCGTCGEWTLDSHRCNEFMHCKHDADWQDSVDPQDPCHFTPSRWTPYWDAKQKAADAPR